MQPEVLVQLRNNQTQMPRVLTYTEGNTEASDIEGEDVEVCRSQQAVACKNRYTVELGKPQRFLGSYSKMSMVYSYRGNEGKPETELVWNLTLCLEMDKRQVSHLLIHV